MTIGSYAKSTGLNPEQKTMLDVFLLEVADRMAREKHGVLVGYCGRPYRHELPHEIAGDDLMRQCLVETWSSGVTSAKIVSEDRKSYLEVTRTVGM